MPQHRTDRGNINTQIDGETESSYKKYKKKEKRPPKKITPTYLHNSGIYYLERFVASKSHFISVMTRKVKRSCMHHKDQVFDDCVKMVHDTADKFEEMGLLNDALYTNGMVTSLRRRGMSRNAIIQKMRVKGIDRIRTIEALERLDEEQYDNDKDAEICAALRLARKKKMGPFKVSDERIDVVSEAMMKEQKKHLARFARAGFSYQIAKTILDMSPEDLDAYNFNI